MLTISDIEAVVVLYILAELFCLCYILYLRFTHKTSDKLFIAPMVAAAAVGAGVGLAQAGVGIAQKIKAAKLAKSNIRPILEDNEYLDDAYRVSQARASEGLNESSKQDFLTNNDRNLSSSIDAILKGGGSVNNISDLYDNNQGVLRRLAVADQEMQARNMQTYFAMLDKKQQEDSDQFFLNQYAPYQDKAALAASLAQQGQENLWKGINAIGGSAMNMMASKSAPDLTGGKTPQAYVPTRQIQSTMVRDPFQAPINVQPTGNMQPGISGLFGSPAPSLPENFNYPIPFRR